MKNILFLAFFLLLAGALYVALNADSSTLALFSTVPGAGKLLPKEADARTQIISASRQKDAVSPQSAATTKKWEQQYLGLLGKIRAESGTFTILKELRQDALQPKPIGGITARAIQGGRLSAGPAGMFSYIEPGADSPKPVEVFLVAIIGDGVEWQKKIGVINETAFIDSPSDDATIWVKVDADVADKLYKDYENNATKKDLYTSVVNYAMEGRIQISPYDRFLAFAENYV